MSTKPVLYYSPLTPPCRSVLLTAAAVGIELDLHYVNLDIYDHMTPEYMKQSPQHTVPMLNDNGVIVTDSHLICSYLVDKYAQNDLLYPKDPIKRMEVKARLFFNCGHLFPRARHIIEPLLYDGEYETPAHKVVSMQNAYDGLERCLQQPDYDYVCGANLTIADFCFIATLTTAMIFAPIDAEKFPKIRAWIERMSELPYYEKNVKEGTDYLGEFIKKKMVENKMLKESKK